MISNDFHVYKLYFINKNLLDDVVVMLLSDSEDMDLKIDFMEDRGYLLYKRVLLDSSNT